jgi:hypothetical protein
MNEQEEIVQEAPADEMLDIEECFRPVAQQYGRSMFALVLNAGLAQEATQQLAGLAQKHASRGGMHAVSILANAFNQVSNAYVARQEWDEGTLAQCSRDIQRAFAGKIAVPGQSIILDS